MGDGEEVGEGRGVGDTVPAATGVCVTVTRGRLAAVGVADAPAEAGLGTATALAVAVVTLSLVASGVAGDVEVGEDAAAGVAPEQPNARAINAKAATPRTAGPLAGNFYETPVCQRPSLDYGADDSPGLYTGGFQISQQLVTPVRGDGDEKTAGGLGVAQQQFFVLDDGRVPDDYSFGRV